MPKDALEVPPRRSVDLESRDYENSSGILFVNRTTGTLVALLLVFLLTAIAYVGSAFFTGEQQLERFKAQQKHLRQELTAIKAKNLALERRLVRLATQVENLKDADD